MSISQRCEKTLSECDGGRRTTLYQPEKYDSALLRSVKRKRTWADWYKIITVAEKSTGHYRRSDSLCCTGGNNFHSDGTLCQINGSIASLHLCRSVGDGGGLLQISQDPNHGSHIYSNYSAMSSDYPARKGINMISLLYESGAVASCFSCSCDKMELNKIGS